MICWKIHVLSKPGYREGKAAETSVSCSSSILWNKYFENWNPSFQEQSKNCFIKFGNVHVTWQSKYLTMTSFIKQRLCTASFSRSSSWRYASSSLTRRYGSLLVSGLKTFARMVIVTSNEPGPLTDQAMILFSIPLAVHSPVTLGQGGL